MGILSHSTNPPDLSIAMVNWNAGRFLLPCLESVRRESTSICLEVLLVDNASSDGSSQLVRDLFPAVRLIANERNLGFAAGNNQAIRKARGHYILLLNPDTVLRPGALRTMVNYMDQHPEAGAATCQLLNADGSIQSSCSRFPTLSNVALDCLGVNRLFPSSRFLAGPRMTDWAHDEEQEVDQPSGACLIIRRQAWEQVGPMDERFFMYFEEVDLCYRLKRAGWRIRFTPTAQIVHYGGQSTRQLLDVRIVALRRSLLRFFRKHYPAWQVLVLRGLLLFEMGWRTSATLLAAMSSRTTRGALRPLLGCYGRVASLCLRGAE